MALQQTFDGVVRPGPIALVGWAAGRIFLAPARALVRRWRNGRDAEWLSELPDYLLADVGIGRAGVEEIRRNGKPGDAR